MLSRGLYDPGPGPGNAPPSLRSTPTSFKQLHLFCLDLIYVLIDLIGIAFVLSSLKFNSILSSSIKIDPTEKHLSFEEISNIT